MKKNSTLGVAIITKNAASHLTECLQSVAFADEIVVLDSGSTDNTREIGRLHGARVIAQEGWPGFGAQKNAAIDELSTDWILSLDADEVVSSELASSIREAVAMPVADVYAIDRLSSFCGQWVRHSGWYPDWIPRLFRSGQARFSADLVHEHLKYSGSCTRLAGKLMHYSYDDLEAVQRKVNDYSTAGAEQRRAHGETSSIGKAVLRGAWAFLRTYLLRRGFLDGRVGVMISIMNAQTVFYRFLKLANPKHPQSTTH